MSEGLEGRTTDSFPVHDVAEGTPPLHLPAEVWHTIAANSSSGNCCIDVCPTWESLCSIIVHTDWDASSWLVALFPSHVHYMYTTRYELKCSSVPLIKVGFSDPLARHGYCVQHHAHKAHFVQFMWIDWYIAWHRWHDHKWNLHLCHRRLY